MSRLAGLDDSLLYERQLERIATLPPHRLHAAGGDGLSLQTLVLEPRAFARRMAAAVATGAYQPAPAAVRQVLLDKPRRLFSFAPADTVLHGVLARILTDAIEPLLSDNLYSYRRKRSPYQAVSRLAAYARAHVRDVPDPRRRGLHVFHCDVKSYGDSIPLHRGAPLWSDLRALLGEIGDSVWTLLERVVRPEVCEEGAASVQLRGLPTGSPITTAIANLYLMPLDRRLEGLDGAFVARYGDDILIAHPRAEVVAMGMSAVAEILAARGLAVNPAKVRRCWWNGAARPDPEHADATPCAEITFLGCRVAFDGTVGLPRAKLRAVLGDVRRRVSRSAALLQALPREERGPALCATLARMLDVGSPFASPYASLLRTVVNDRRQLAHVDYLIARAVVAALTGADGVRGFRDIPYRRLRGEWGLPSLVSLRNDYRRGRR